MAQNKKGNTESIVRDLITPVAEQLGLRLWDVRFVKEGTEHYLRITIGSKDQMSALICALKEILEESL